MKFTYSSEQINDNSTPPRQPKPVERRPTTRESHSIGCVLAGIVALAALGGGVWWLCGTREDAGAAKSAASDVTTSTAESNPAGDTDSKETPKVTVSQVKAYLTPSEAEILQLYSYVINSPFLAENFQYANRMKIIPLIYEETNDIVNAVASCIGTVKGDQVVNFHGKITLYGGAARYARLVGLAAAMEDNGYKEMLKNLVTTMPSGLCSKCGEDDCIRYIAQSELVNAFASEKIRQRAMSYSSGTLVSVLAHEAGHQALGHLLSKKQKPNLEIDRNQEREADSFASSIISASPFGEYIFAGTLFWHYAHAIQAGQSDDGNGDHPLSRERFENFVRANREKAEAMGITVK